MIWTDAFLNNLALQAEDDISSDVKCIVDRLSIATIAGNPFLYIPEYVLGIRRILWKGLKVWPLDRNEYKNYKPLIGTYHSGAFTDAFSDAFYHESTTYSPQSRPKFYITGLKERQQITLYPAPSESLATSAGNLWDSTVISTCVVIEYYRAADGVTWTLPSWIRRVLIRDYVLSHAFNAEGDGQNLVAAKYYNDHLELMKQVLVQVNNGVFVNAQSYLDDDAAEYPANVGRVAPPQLKAKYTDF